MLEWDQLARGNSELAKLPPDHRWDSLPETVTGLLNAALCKRPMSAAYRELVLAALQHGQDRRSAGISPDVVFREYGNLHDAIWHHLRNVLSTAHRLDAILKIDMAISLATRASLSGYHRAKLEETGSWAGIVDHLVDEWILFNRETTG
ncbi:MAG TPA: hypothetical protein VF166_08930 [Gemmatimonadaceae bacterium]